MADPKRVFLTAGEAAAMLGLSRATVRRAVGQGRLIAWHTPGKHLRIAKSACLELAHSLGRIELVGQPSRESVIEGRGI